MSSMFGEGIYLYGRKEHRCEWCWQSISMETLHYCFHGMWEGDWQHWRMHIECMDSYSDEEEEFCPGDGVRPATISPGVEKAAWESYFRCLMTRKRRSA